MPNALIYKISFLRVTLMVTSAIIAAIVPSGNQQAPYNGVLVPSTEDTPELTCVYQSGEQNCHYTEASATTTSPNIIR